MWTRLTAVVVAPLGVFGDRLVAGRLLAAADGYYYYLPLHILAGRAWRAGTLPAWNPYAFSGMPLLATNQVAVFYPPNLTFVLLSPALANNLIVLFDFAVAGAGAFLLARRLTADDAAATVAGLAFALSGFMAGQVVHQSVIATVAWLPWALLGVELLRERVTALRLAATGFAVGLSLLAGHSQMFCFLVLLVVLYVALVAALDGRGNRLRPLAATAVAVAIGLGVAAVQLVPTLAVVGHTDRSGLDYDAATSFSYPTSHLPLVTFPYLFGNAAPSDPYTAPYRGEWDLEELSGYPGLVALALAAAGLGAARRDKRVAALAGIGGVGLLMAMGGSTPFGHVVHAVPIFGRFRSWGRYVVGFDLAVALLAAYGVVHLRRARGRVRRAALVRAAAVPALVVALAFVVRLVHAVNEHMAHGPTRFWATAVPITFAVLGAGACWLVARAGGRRAVTAGLALLVAVDGALTFAAFAAWRGAGVSSTAARRAYSSRTPTAFGFPADTTGGVDRYLVAAPDMRAAPQRPDLTDVKRLRSANGYDPLAPRDYIRTLHMLYDGDVRGTRVLDRPDSRVLDLLRVTTVLLDARARPPAVLTGEGRPVPHTSLVRYDYQPRLADAFLVGATERLPRADVLERVDGRIPFEPSATALVDSACGRCGRAVTPGPAGQVEVERWATSSVALDVAADRPAVLVVSQAWFPGWKATVDGRDAPVVRVDGLVQGVPVDAGRHRVRLRYRVPGLPAGAAISIVTVVALSAAVVVERRRSPRRAG